LSLLLHYIGVFLKEFMPEFNPLKIPQKRLSTVGGEGAGYKVFDESGEFETIEADTAAEAMEKSGIKEPVKIVRIFGAVQNVIDGAELEVVEDEMQEEVASAEETA
jgi:hypothetical protein